MCGIFVDEVPQEFHRERKAVSEKLLEATELALPIVQSITADDATADLDPEAVLQLLGSFQERVQQAIALEERIHPTVLHAWLKEAITSVMDPSPLSPSWQFAPTAMVARGRSPGRNKGKGKGATWPNYRRTGVLPYIGSPRDRRLPRQQRPGARG